MTSSGSHAILVIEHDLAIGRSLVEQLVTDGYPTRHAHPLQHARALIAMSASALVVVGHLDDAPRGALDLLAEIRHGHAPWPENLGSRPRLTGQSCRFAARL